MGKNDFCCAYGCSNNRKKNPDLKFYRIPKNKSRRKTWIQRIKRENFTPSDNTRLCSAHFVDGAKSDDPSSKSFTPSIFSYNRLQSTPRRSKKSSRDIASDDTQPAKRRRVLVTQEPERGRPKIIQPTIDEHKVWGACLESNHVLKQYDYCKTQIDPQSLKVNTKIIEELSKLFQRTQELEDENNCLKQRCLSLESIKLDDRKFQFYTGFPNYSTFKALYNYLDVVALQKKTNWRGPETKVGTGIRKGTRTKLTLEEELFMVVIRLRVGLTLTDLSHRFGLNESSVSRIFTTWINLLYFHMKELCQMPEYCEQLGKAEQFSSFEDLRVIVDCTEIFTQKPSSLKANKEIYSNYKSHTTFKFLVAINACAAIVYVSRGWGGRVSDKHITANSVDFIATLEPGDEVMADRGFDISDILGENGVRVTIPDFKGQGRSQLKKCEGKRSEKIAEARIHVERAIQRIKTYHILDSEVRLTMAHLAEQIFTVCAYLVNFQPPILK